MSTRALSDDGGRYRWVIFGVTAAPWLVFLAGSSLGEIAPLVALSFLLGTPHVMATVGLYLQPDLQPHLRAHRLRYVEAPSAWWRHRAWRSTGLGSVGQGLLGVHRVAAPLHQTEPGHVQLLVPGQLRRAPARSNGG
jgi:hypothetical protein